jgi:putative hemolysin
MLQQDSAPRLIDLRSGITGPVKRSLFRLIEGPVEKVLSLGAINRAYARSLSLQQEQEQDGSAGGGDYFRTVLRTLDISYDLSDEDRAKIPTTGPVVVVANHPFGAIDGIILGDILTGVRPDVRLMGNHLLAAVPQVRDRIISVDPFGGPAAAQANIAPLKACLRWLHRGGLLGTFPAGTVSHLRVRDKCISDPPWQRSVVGLVRRTGATVVPVYFEGRNSMMFQLAGLIHRSLRTALLPKELLKRSHSRLSVFVGRPIGRDKIERYPDDEVLIDYLRWKTYMLKHRKSPVRPRFFPRPKPKAGKAEQAAEPQQPLVDEVPAQVLATEVAQLPPEALLAELGDYQVFIADAGQIPEVLREIGRLREKTFREVSEGTGLPLDLDRYDPHYLHLFMWNRTAREIVGSYRIGRVDDLLARQGVRGLYTSCLFKYNQGFLEQLGPAIELGRSFVRREYQRKPASLALIWRGIGEYLVRHPRYKILFGPVSISQEYQGLSRRLMVEFLESQRGDEILSGLVKAKNPPRERLDREERAVLESLVKDVDDISTLVSEIEEDGRGVPVLLKHYLRLNARLLSFNVDENFGNCIDGLIVVDLRTTDAKILKRFMGEAGYAAYAGQPAEAPGVGEKLAS